MAKNGTGKTGAYLIPLLEKTDTQQNHVQGDLVRLGRGVGLIRLYTCTVLNPSDHRDDNDG